MLKTITMMREVRHRGIFKVGWVFTLCRSRLFHQRQIWEAPRRFLDVWMRPRILEQTPNRARVCNCEQTARCAVATLQPSLGQKGSLPICS
jgi:hypothetical protein